MPEQLNPGDRITARLFGQYVTLQRCDWQQLADDARADTDLHKRAAYIAAHRRADGA